MDLARSLLRIVARAFYETRHILVIDALFIHSVLHAEDLALLLGMQQKDLRKLCGRLREDRLIAVHSRPELREGQTRPVNREYYYIPLHPVIDAIKYRRGRSTSVCGVKRNGPSSRFSATLAWTDLNVNDVGTCFRERMKSRVAARLIAPGHEKNSKLMAQLDPMLKLLKQIDSVEVPPNDFDTAWDHKVDVIRNQYTNPSRPGVVVSKQSAVRGVSKTDASTLEVSLTSTAEKSAEEQAREAARKAALEKQNALPIWHTQSTVSTDVRLPQVKTEPNGVSIKPEVDIKPEVKEEQKPDIDSLDDSVAAYYAEMAREKEREAQEDVSEEESDEEEDEFEDVEITPSAVGTPANQADATKAPSVNGSLKRELESDSGSSAPQTNAPTPITPGDEGPAAKKIKLEPEVKKEESDEEEDEFEDV
ncbi:transcription initiation factor IIE subunit alpha [Coccidioides immitis RMSCC 3703]|uniref:Transcription initiation factor IIE subunit alpha n=1 Tax=Coccidioides immitis RMSCC 3703 TaxID=454286 RepID=A0A0J8QS88_COCIT|nr:transcription initiation factor IIE subunit alpha [Coccidioides immitis RMSCC 3703]